MRSLRSTFCLLPLGLAALRDVAPAVPWELMAAALGLVALAAMSVQFVTSGRSQAISGRLGIDRVTAFHKRAFWCVLIALILNPLGYALPTWLDDSAFGTERMVAYLTLPHYRSGVIALTALQLIAVSSSR